VTHRIARDVALLVLRQVQRGEDRGLAAIGQISSSFWRFSAV
jgi:hypothetical protein